MGSGSESDVHQLLEKIQETARWSLHRALRGEGRQPVLLKIAVDGEHRDPRAVEQLEHEYEVTARLGSAATLRALAFERIGGAPALVLEDFGGVPLRHFMAERLEPDRVLALAIAVTAAVGELHRHGVLHKDLKPDSVLVDPVTGEVKLTGLGIASLLPRELQPAVSPAGIGLGVIEGTLAYMSPEQTGRMNRALDQRSDLYALGVTFYEMATGSLPFSAADPLDWIHWHMAGVPRPPHEVEARVPPSLSAVILKLLAKTPDERYQSAVGLGRDLERCRDRWRAGRTEPFPLGSDDVSERLQMPQRLYGRQRPSGELLRAFERVATEGTPELVLVAGSAGVGKSALVRELERPVTARGGFFLYDKVDQLRGAIPCAPFVRALRELIRDLLAGTDLALAGWRARLQAAVGDNGRIIIDVIPELEAIIGPQPPVAELRPIEARTRFDRTFLRFIGAFTSPEHPLVIVLDDLQWADSGSLNLIRNIAGSGGLRHLLLVGTYRPGGDQGVAELRPAKASVRELELVALSVADLRALVSDAFGAGEPESEALAALLHQKTGGNPFFVIQFVDTLWREGLVQFDPTTRGWRWDLARIAGKGVTSNLVDLMTERLLRLPERVRRTLSMAAALGDGLAALPLARIDGRPAPDVEEDLLRAAHEGLLLREGQRYRFTHDRVQEAAYALIPPGGRQAAHLRIGRALLAATPPERIDEALFDIVSQLDRGAALIVDPAERRRLAELALRAGRRAKAANAYAPALRFFVAGLDALPEDASPGQGASYELGQALLLGRGECELLSGHPDEARRLSVRLAERARTKLDAVAAHLLAQDAMLVTGDILAAVADQRQTLALLGIDLPARPTRADAEAARDQVRALLGDRPLESILDLPAMDDPELEAAMRVNASAALTDSNLYCVHVCLLTALSLRRGLCASSSLWFGSYGFVLVRFFEDPALGHRFAQVAHQLAERTADRGARGRTRFFLVVSSYWMGPPDELQAHARAGLEDALEAGDLIVAGYHHALGVTALLQDGELLERVAAEAQASIDFSRRFGLRDIVDDLVVVRQLARCLRGGTVALSSLDDPDFSEMAFEAGLTAERLTHLRCWYWIARMRVAFTAGDPERALAFFAKAEELAWVITGQSIERDLRFYGALAMAGQAGRSGPEEGAAWLAKIDRLRAPIGRWARLNPARFAHQEALIAAEMARLRGAAEEAGPLYEESLRRAREGGFVHDQALAYELAAQFHRERGFTAFADLYLREAHAAYLRWGAEGKARDLERLHPAVLTPPDSSAAAAATTWRARSEQIDLLSVVKASQAISQETVHDRLLERLMQVVLAQSGASQGWLVLRRRGDLSIAAEAALAADGVRVVIPAEKTLAPERLPISVLQYTARTGLPVVIDDTTEGGRFSGDEYLRRERPRSVLCLAIERQGEVVGMLYLENRTLVGAFTGGRLTVLELLAAQVAISLENARALGETEAARAAAEQAVAVRDEFLSIASHELNTPMNALMLSLEGMLGRGGLTPDPVTFSRLATLAERQGRRLTHVVRDLLDVTRAERGELRLRPTSVDLAALVRDDVASLHPELARTGSEVSLDLEEGVVGWWDPARIDQVVVNLLSNAAKFGGGRPISVRLDRAAERARLTVSDQGIGIDAEGQARIFHRFERRVSAAHYGGLGLGLYICRRIVEAHGGTIAVHSVPGAGASFTVELPCRRTEEAGR